MEKVENVLWKRISVIDLNCYKIAITIENAILFFKSKVKKRVKCDKFYFTLEFEIQMWIWIWPNIWVGPNTYSPLIEQVKSDYG